MSGDNVLLTIFVLLPVLMAWGGYAFFIKFKVHRGESSRGLRLIGGNLIVLILLLSIVLLGGELYYRFMVDQTDAMGLGRGNRRWFERHYQFNDLGVRDSVAEYPYKRTRGVTRVSFLGDSFAAGHGVKDVERRFINRIRAARPQWDVHALVVNGYDTGLEMDMARTLMLRGYETDVMVLVYCLNDIADMIQGWQDKLKEVREVPPPPWVVRHSFFLDTMYYRWKQSRDPMLKRYYPFLREAYDGGLWDAQRRRLEYFYTNLKKRRVRLMVVTFPLVATTGEDYKYRDVHRRLDELWRGLGVPHMDLLPVLDALPSSDLVVNRRDPHPNELAHGIAAEQILEFLDRQINQPQPAGR